MYAVIFVFGVGGNITVLGVILCKKLMRTSINMYILNLSASDALICFVMFTSPLHLLRGSNRNSWVLHRRSSVQTTTMEFAGLFTLTAIALKRYRAVLYYFSSQTKSLARTAIIILCIDIFAIIINLPEIITMKVLQNKHGHLGCKKMKSPSLGHSITWSLGHSVTIFNITTN